MLLIKTVSAAIKKKRKKGKLVEGITRMMRKYAGRTIACSGPKLFRLNFNFMAKSVLFGPAFPWKMEN